MVWLKRTVSYKLIILMVVMKACLPSWPVLPSVHKVNRWIRRKGASWKKMRNPALYCLLEHALRQIEDSFILQSYKLVLALLWPLERNIFSPRENQGKKQCITPGLETISALRQKGIPTWINLQRYYLLFSPPIREHKIYIKENKLQG